MLFLRGMPGRARVTFGRGRKAGFKPAGRLHGSNVRGLDRTGRFAGAAQIFFSFCTLSAYMGWPRAYPTFGTGKLFDPEKVRATYFLWKDGFRVTVSDPHTGLDDLKLSRASVWATRRAFSRFRRAFLLLRRVDLGASRGLRDDFPGCVERTQRVVSRLPVRR